MTDRRYLDIVKDAQEKRLEITDKTQKRIARLYRDMSREAGQMVKNVRRKDTKQKAIDLGKALREASDALYKEAGVIIRDGIASTASAVTGAELKYWGGLIPEKREILAKKYTLTAQKAVEELESGNVYHSRRGLDKRLWIYNEREKKDISYIIERGILENKSAYEVAKDLEIYVNPAARRPWDWSKIYPKSQQKVDYCAQRLARTSITHAYQMAFVRSTQDNPFIEAYLWHASNSSRVCDLCAERDGREFDKHDLPLDHPNGMCVVTAVMKKSEKIIVSELQDYIAGAERPDLDIFFDFNHI